MKASCLKGRGPVLFFVQAHIMFCRALPCMLSCRPQAHIMFCRPLASMLPCRPLARNFMPELQFLTNLSALQRAISSFFMQRAVSGDMRDFQRWKKIKIYLRNAFLDAKRRKRGKN